MEPTEKPINSVEHLVGIVAKNVFDVNGRDLSFNDGASFYLRQPAGLWQRFEIGCDLRLGMMFGCDDALPGAIDSAANENAERENEPTMRASSSNPTCSPLSTGV